MKWIKRYNESKTIKATDETIKEIVDREIIELGNESDLNHIDVNRVTNMESLFRSKKFNGDISNWNVQNVLNMDCIFHISPFNGDISRWNVGNVRDMSNMFSYCNFNKNISLWNVEKVEEAKRMFVKSSFDGDLSKWRPINIKKLDLYMFDLSSLRREPWWYILGIRSINMRSMFESIDEWNCIDVEKKIIWKSRLEKSFKEFGIFPKLTDTFVDILKKTSQFTII